MLKHKAIILSSFIGAMSTLAFAPALLAQPVITTVTDNITQAATVTITGSGFGIKSQAGPISWDNFESGAAGTTLGKPIVGPTWTFLSASPNPSYSNVQAHAGKNSAVVKWQNYSISSFGWNNQGPYGRLYISFWRYMDPQDPSTVPINHKILYFYGNAPGSEFPQFMIGAVMQSWDQWRYAVQNYPTDDWTFPDLLPSNWSETVKVWQRWEVYVELDNPYTESNGKIKGYIDGRLVQDLSGLNLTDVDGKFKDMKLGHMFQGYHPGGTDQCFFDDVYVDSSQARIEIGNMPTWDANTHREIQIPTLWSDTNIKFTANLGSFSSGEVLYLYVVDQNGNVNKDGYKLSSTVVGVPPSSEKPVIKSSTIK